MPLVNLAGFIFDDSPIIMNGGGTCKSLERVKELARTNADTIVYGSVTYEPRTRNAGTVFYKSSRFSQNSIGMDNEGGEHHRKTLPEMVAIAHDAGKRFILSVAGDTPDEYAILTEIGDEAGADIVEQNWGCPNKWHGAVQGQIPSYDLNLAQEILARTEERIGYAPLFRLFVKVSWLDPFSIRRFAAEVFPLFASVRGVVAINTIANTLSYDNFGHARITPGGGLAGFAGPAILPIGLGQVRQWRDALPPHIAVIGCGGITEARDLIDYIDRAGASAVQVASAIFGQTLEERNYHIFADLKNGYRHLRQSN